MPSATSSSSPLPYTTVLHEECYPVDEAPVRSTRSVSWGPHNVLQICTRWYVQLCIATLRRAALRLMVRHHPLCYHPNSAPQELVLGAAWSTTLVPEVRYPAEARLCVQTTTCLLIYRVTRCGQQTVRASKGVGISFQVRVEPTRDSSSSGSSPTESTLRRRRPGNATRGRARGRLTGRRERSSSSSSTSSAVVSSSEEEELRALQLTSRRSSSTTMGVKSTTTRTPTGSRQCANNTASAASCQSEMHGTGAGLQGCGTLMGYEWCVDDLLVAVTTTGVFLMPFCNDYSDDAQPQVRPLPAPAHLFASDALGPHVTPPSCVTKVLRQPDDERLVHGDLLVVAGVRALRVLHVNARSVAVLGLVQLPQLTSVPSCLCCIASPPTPRPATSPHAVVQVTTFVSAPTLTARGHFGLPVPSHAPITTSSAQAPPSRETWALESVYDLASLGSSDTTLRGLIAVALPPPALDATWEAWQSGPLRTPSPSMSATTATAAVSETGTWVVLGVARLAMFALFPRAPQAVPLLRCPSLATAVEMPAHAAVGVSGVAVHASCALALVLLHTGRSRLAPLHLMAVPANDETGFLYRVLELSGVCAPTTVEVEVTGATSRVTQRRHQALLYELWRRQPSFAYFTWELLFPFDADAAALRLYAEAWRQYTAPPFTPTAPTSGPTTLRGHIPGHSFRRRYLALRTHFGIELYLRWPMPEREAQLLGTVRTATHSDAEQGGQWVWWQLLLSVWRRCPWDVSCLGELLLANAVTLLAKRHGYAAAALTTDERLRAAADASATDAWQLNDAGAADYIVLYLRAQEQVLSCVLTPAMTTKDEETIAEVKPGGEGGWLAPWCCDESWVSALRAFLASCQLDVGHESNTTTPYACSVCDAPRVARLTADFAFTSEHGTPASRVERHTTVFSGKTFSPLSLYSTEAVLTRCMGCGMWDFAVGPLCRLCGGLL